MSKNKFISRLRNLVIIFIIAMISINIANAVRIIIHPDDDALHQYAGSPIRLNLLIEGCEEQTEVTHQNPDEVPWVFDFSDIPVNTHIQTLDIDSVNPINTVQAVLSGPFSIPQTTFILLKRGFLTSLTPLESTHIRIEEEAL